LKNMGFLDKIEPHELSVGHCYRCHTIIEPYLSKQWFVKMKPLAKPAIEAVKKGKIKFHPQRWTKVYLNWMENIQDWCISRQIWWGHRLPVYYCKNCQVAKSDTINQKPDINSKSQDIGIMVSKIKPLECPVCGSKDIYQDEDVLDTWFSSWLWPFATFGSNEEDLKYFYPTSTLVTAPEIIFFWVARMIMAGFEFMGKQPFKDVYIHGTVRDIEGKKMSKSLGNIIDPLEIIEKYGTDALRFSIISITSQGQDVFLSEQRFEQGRNFANKIWNASRFILMNLDPAQVTVDLCEFYKKEELNIVNRWILSRFYSTLEGVNKSLESFKFNEAANLLYGFFWHEFCDWYLEIIKPDIKERQNQIIMFKILEKFLRALHPFMPFVSEEIWQKLPHAGESIMVRPWPHIQEQIIDVKLEKDMRVLFEIITSIRNLRAEIEIKPELKIPLYVFPHSKTAANLIAENKESILNLAKLERLEVLAHNTKPKGTISSICEAADIYLSFSGLIDIPKELQKAIQKLDNLKRVVTSKGARLKNAEFIKKAPKEIVEKENESLAEANNTIKRLERTISELS
ncbi:MAG: class I tRNA ligase family protein, partial [Candidatus Omnitrophica bacterium]|nr:class I tRNA ligase family protein [Candidatus Omnitrophota bacterium]